MQATSLFGIENVFTYYTYKTIFNVTQVFCMLECRHCIQKPNTINQTSLFIDFHLKYLVDYGI